MEHLASLSLGCSEVATLNPVDVMIEDGGRTGISRYQWWGFA